MTCDCCGDDWEESFFCDKCTKRATEERQGDEKTGSYFHVVCGNCCICHLIKSGEVLPATAQGVVAVFDDKDIPF